MIDKPLGNLVGGALRAQAYTMEVSSLQVPCALPQSLGKEITQSLILCVSLSPDGKTQENTKPVSTKAICGSVWMHIPYRLIIVKKRE